MKSLLTPLQPQFQFASFNFPKYVFRLDLSPLKQRIERAKNPCVGEYQHAPRPLAGAHPGTMFYLNSDLQPGLRWQWADAIINLKHNGWYCDSYRDSVIRGLVMRLPHARGFLAGWSMGEGMLSATDGDIYRTEREAAYAADDCARIAAEIEREADEKDRHAQENEEAQYWAERDVMTD